MYSGKTQGWPGSWSQAPDPGARLGGRIFKTYARSPEFAAGLAQPGPTTLPGPTFARFLVRRIREPLF